MRPVCVIIGTAFSLIHCGSPPHIKPTPSDHAAAPEQTSAQIHGCSIEATFTPDKSTFVQGAPVFTTFRVATICDKPLWVLDGGDYRNRLGRANSFAVTAVGGDGRSIAPIDSGPQFGGIIAPHAIQRDKPFEKRLLIAHWVDFPHPGQFALAVEKMLEIGESMTPHSQGKARVPVSASAHIRVEPASPTKLGIAIDSLGAELFSEGDRAPNEALAALAMVHDVRVVPYLVRFVLGRPNPRKSNAVWPLSQFTTDEALAGIVHALAVEGLRLTAAQVLGESAHPKAWDALWALRSNQDENVRLTVLHALAKRNFADELSRLSLFENDASAIVRGEAKRYIQERHRQKLNRGHHGWPI